jgi:hypothetical protein
MLQRGEHALNQRWQIESVPKRHFFVEFHLQILSVFVRTASYSKHATGTLK